MLVEGNLMLRDRKKRCMFILKEFLTQLVLEFQTDSGQFKMTKPARDMLTKFVTPCGGFSKSKDHEDAQNRTSAIRLIFVSAFVRIRKSLRIGPNWYQSQQIQI